MRILLLLIAFCLLPGIATAFDDSNVSFTITQGGTPTDENPAPLGVFFNAVGVDHSIPPTTLTTHGSDNVWHDMTYEWNFGDPDQGTWEFSGIDKNHAWGFVAAHVYDDPGVYTVTLTVTDSAGATGTATDIIYVDDPNTIYAGNRTKCFSSSETPVAGSGGCPTGADVQQTSSWNNAVSWVKVASGRRALLRRDDTFTASSNPELDGGGSPGMIAAFGSGAKPKVVVSGQSDIITINGDSSGYRLVDLNFDMAGSTSATDRAVIDHFSGTSAQLSDFLLYRIDFTNMHWAITLGGKANMKRVNAVGFPQLFLVESTFDLKDGSGYCFFGGRYESADLGNDYRGCGDTFEAAHVVRSTTENGYVSSHNIFQDCATSGLQLRMLDWADSDWTNWWTQNMVVSFNQWLTVNGCTGLLGLGAASPAVEGRKRNILVENNLFVIGSQGNTGQAFCGTEGVTVRNNVAMSTVAYDDPEENYGPRYFTIQACHISGGGDWPFVNDEHRVYNNTCYCTNTICDKSEGCVEISHHGSDHYVRNNLAYSPNDSDWTVTDGTNAIRSNNLQQSDFSANPFVSGTPTTLADFRLNDTVGGGRVAQDAGFALAGKVAKDAAMQVRPVDGSDVDSDEEWDVGAWEYGATFTAPTGGPATTPDNQILGGSLGFNEPTTRESGAPLDNLDECTAVLTPTGGSSSLVTFPASSPNGGGVFDIDLSPYAGQMVEYYGSCTNADGEGPQSPKGSVEVALPLDPPAAPSIEVR
jgi:PKD repeat protein